MKSIVIVGAGIGGLTAANLLAKNGHRVTLFEAHDSPGGYTAGFWRKGFYFESGTLSFESADMIFKVMKDIGVFDKIKFIRQATRFRSKKIDGVCRTYRDLKRLFYRSYPSARESLDGYFGAVDKMYNPLHAMMKPAGIADYLLLPARLANIGYLFKRLEKVTITKFAARYFDPQSELYRIFKGFGYPDMSAAIAGPAFLSFFDDYWTVEGGMQSWADVLADNFRGLGGVLKLKSPVDRILTDRGRAIGVASQGKEYRADYVISACDYKKTFLRYLDDRTLLDPAVLEKIERAAVSEGIFAVYLGLNMTNETLRKHLQIPHVVYYDETPGADIRQSDDENFFEKRSVTLYSPSLINGKLAPEGKSSLMIQAVAPFRWMNNWGGGDKNRYRDLKARVKETLISKASALVPDLTPHIDFEEAATPLTFERYTGNTDGATSAWSWNPAKKFYGNIMTVKVTTPVKNLLIGSCWSSQIGGIPGAINAAKKCARKID